MIKERRFRNCLVCHKEFIEGSKNPGRSIKEIFRKRGSINCSSHCSRLYNQDLKTKEFFRARWRMRNEVIENES